MKEIVESLIKKVLLIGRIKPLNRQNNKGFFFPPGHFYSPIISVSELKKREDELWNVNVIEIPEGIDLNEKNQVQLLTDLSAYYKDLPFEEENNKKNRYYFNNIFYSYSDGILLYSMMRHFKPKRIIEAGSGFTSALMLDVNNLFFEDKISLTFIDPHPERLYSLITKNDRQQNTVIEKNIQLTDLEIYKALEKGDMLFIDSSHVAKSGGDLNFILFEILPILKSGVLIHFHDIFFPFEYPKEWVYDGRSWNEIYFLRAFLMHNHNYEIILFSDYLHKLFKNAFKDMPLCYKNTGGHIWIRKK